MYKVNLHPVWLYPKRGSSIYWPALYLQLAELFKKSRGKRKSDVDYQLLKELLLFL
jgi:hypothetical protein